MTKWTPNHQKHLTFREKSGSMAQCTHGISRFPGETPKSGRPAAECQRHGAPGLAAAVRCCDYHRLRNSQDPRWRCWPICVYMIYRCTHVIYKQVKHIAPMSPWIGLRMSKENIAGRFTPSLYIYMWSVKFTVVQSCAFQICEWVDISLSSAFMGRTAGGEKVWAHRNVARGLWNWKH